MSLVILRTCTEIRDASNRMEAGRTRPGAGRPLESFRSTPAYVLLGDPGAGKTTAFTRECNALGEAACFVTARDFLTFEPEDRPEWRGKTLFIDGLDERRAGSPDKRTPFDGIRRRLAKLGNPCFRLSCRTADWLGENDRTHLASVTPGNADVTVVRLDPLTDSDTRKILEARTDIPDASAFVATAKERGVDGLLRSPQSLGLLADVVTRGGTWPETRLETFAVACRHMAAEQNQNHRYAAPEPAVDSTLDAAGRMCAILLLTGASGFATDSYDADGDYLSPDQCAWDRDTCRHALSTKLFTGETETRRFTPVHRHLAEYIAARHIQRLITNGKELPWRRVLSLITGEDGAVVTQFRGLSAWLAALCPDARADLIERDPIGVVSYGDVRSFTPEEKRTLLVSLSREDERLRSATWTRAAVGALVTEDMESVLRNSLTSPSTKPYFTALVLHALTHGTPLPGLADLLFDMVYRGHRQLQLPCLMLDAFTHNCSDSTRDDKLERLLADLKSGRITDWNNELLGTVLTELYPRRIAAPEIWKYLSTTAQRYASGPFHHFWRCHLVENASDVAALLDAFVSRRHKLKQAVESQFLHDVPLKLLARGIEECGDTPDPARLCDWLTVDMFPDLRGDSTDSVRRIGSWLQRHPDILKAVIAEVARRPLDSMDTGQSWVDHIRYGAEFPSDYGLWCLQQAVSSDDISWTRHFLHSCCRSLAYQVHDRGLPLELLFERTQGSPRLRKELDGLLRCPVYFPDGLEERRRSREERKRNHVRWIAYVRSHKADLRRGECTVDILYQVGKAYFGSLIEASGASPQERIRNLFRNEQSLIDAALAGLRNTIGRVDVPAPAEIIGLIGSGQEYRLGLPFLAGLDELEPEAVLQLNDNQLRQALAFHHGATARRPGGHGSGWYRTLLERRAETVADVLVQCVAATLRRGQDDHSIVFQLLMDDHACVASHVAMRLLGGFPLRATIPQLQNLDHLLHAAYRHADRQSFLELIAERLSLSSMTVSQRVHWLAMGVIVCQNSYLDPLKDVLQRGEGRTSHLSEFLLRAGPTIDDLTVPALKYYISLLGSTLGRWVSNDSDIIATESASVAPCIYEMIQRLAMIPDLEASAALEELVADVALSSWRLNLVTARDRQRMVRRDAVYRHPTFDQVCHVLNDGSPANPGDLAALLVDRLDEIAASLRTRNSDEWRHYWNEDQYARPCKPKPENSCRKALLSVLQKRLPPSVDAQPEGMYASDRRADIRVACNGFHIPVETKRDNHRQLWSAIRSQLIEGYANDPATGGYGIYLVFWFGRGGTPRSPSGLRPAGPDELREQLEASLSEEQRRTISVRVVDVSPASP